MNAKIDCHFVLHVSLAVYIVGHDVTKVKRQAAFKQIIRLNLAMAHPLAR